MNKVCCIVGEMGVKTIELKEASSVTRGGVGSRGTEEATIAIRCTTSSQKESPLACEDSSELKALTAK